MKRIANLLAVLILLALLIVGLLPGIASAATVQEYYNTGNNSSVSVYDNNWASQTFTTSSAISYYVSTINLQIWRTGSPGNITVSLRNTVSGLPHGDDLIAAIYNGDTLDTTPAGGNTTITMPFALVLAAGIKYAIVVAADNGNITNCINWAVDTSSPTYTRGSRADSINSGVTWSADTTDDMMFEVYGETWMTSPNPIEDVMILPNIYEDGDWYITIHYNNIETGYPDGNCPVLYSLVLFDGPTDIAKVPCPSWGYMPALIYISKTTKLDSGIVWGSNTVGIELRYNVDGTSVYSYMIQSEDWQDTTIDLDKWVRGTAQEMETYYGVDMYTEEISSETGNKTFTAGEGVLTIVSSQLFANNMPGLDELRPYLFYMVEHSPEMTDKTYSHTYSNTFDWTTRLGPQAVSDLDYVAAIVNMPSGKTLAGGLMFAGYLVLAGIGVWRLGSPAVAIGAAVPFLVGGIWIGIIPVALGAILSLIMVIAFVWIIWLRST